MKFMPFNKSEAIDDSYIDEIANILWSYLGSLHQNGQIYDDNLVHKDGAFYSYFFMPELDSLDEKYCSGYAIRDLAGIKKDFHIETEVLGKNVMDYAVCNCKESSWYVLYANRAYNISPIICGDCLGMIPSYKFNQIDIPKHIRTVLGWQEDYNLIDKLWFNSYFDRFTYRQMSNPNAQLSIDGSAICAAYEKALNKPFYYFLFHHSEARKSITICPKCGGDWVLNEKIQHISYKCDRCRLVSI